MLIRVIETDVLFLILSADLHAVLSLISVNLLLLDIANFNASFKVRPRVLLSMLQCVL